MEPSLVYHPAYSELVGVIVRLNMKSQVSAARMESSCADASEDIGGKRPSGGLHARDDHQQFYRQKSAVYFQHRLERCQGPHRLVALLEEAREALDAWERQPLPTERPLSTSDPQWKLWVAASKVDIADVVRWYGVSRGYVRQVRQAYVVSA